MNKNKPLLFISAILSLSIILLSSFATAQYAVDLGTASNFVILSKSGISTTGTTSIVGNIGVSPIDSTAITGFGLTKDSSNQFATSSLVTGKIYAADYTAPTPSVMTTAISNMQTAYNSAAGRTLPDYTELGAGNIGGMTLTPGLYKWGTSVTIPTDLTLNCQGNANAVFIFQIAQTLDISSGKKVVLIGSCKSSNIFWQVAGQTTLGTTSVFNGNILDLKAIVLNTGATLNGRALSQTAVTLDANKVSLPSTTATIQENEVNNSRKNATPSNYRNYTVDYTPINKTNSVSTIITRDGDRTEVVYGNGGTNLISEGVRAETQLPVEVENDNLHVRLSNGVKAELKIMPSTASETAIRILKLKFCTEENNCTITLKEVGRGTETKVAYNIRAQKKVRVFGLFRAKMNVETNVDAETNEIISTRIPWWSFLATKSAE